MAARLRQLVDERLVNDALLQRHTQLSAYAKRLREEQSGQSKGQHVLNMDYSLGLGFTCSAVIEDFSYIRVAVGIDNLYLDLTPDETYKYCAAKMKLLEDKSKALYEREQALRKEYQNVNDALSRILNP